MTSSFVRQILVKSVREAEATVWSIEFETLTAFGLRKPHGSELRL